MTPKEWQDFGKALQIWKAGVEAELRVLVQEAETTTVSPETAAALAWASATLPRQEPSDYCVNCWNDLPYGQDCQHCGLKYPWPLGDAK